MIKVQPAITQMNNGHIAPIIEGRTDIQVYGYSCRQAENTIPLVYGANKNRGGTIYVTSTKDSTKKAALIPFKVGQNVSYQLEFGDQYIRFYRNHEEIMSGANIYEISTPFVQSDLFDEKGIFQIDYVQSGDVIYLAHDKYPTMKLSRRSDRNWSIEKVDFANGPWMESNPDENAKIYASSTIGGVTLNAVAIPDRAEFTDNDVGFYLEPQQGDGFCVVHCKFKIDGVAYPDNNYHDTYITTRTPGARIIRDAFPPSSTFYATWDPAVENKIMVGSFDANYVGHTFDIYVYNPYTLVETEVFHRQYTFTSGSASHYPAIFDSSMIGRKMRIKNVVTYPAWFAGKTGISVGTIVVSDGKYYSALDSGTCGNVKPIHEKGTESDGNIRWNCIGDGYGIVKISSVTNYHTAIAQVIEPLDPSLTSSSNASWRWEVDLVGQGGIYPSSLGFYKDRLVFGINANSGPKMCFSCTGDYENFSDLTFGEVLPSNAITLNILGDLNKINWICAGNNLFVGTEGSVIMAKPMTENEVFGPNNITYDEISNIGACKIKPIRIGDDILYLGRLTKDVYAIAYNFQSDSYEPDEVSLSAYDLLDNGIRSWALQYEPNRIVWMVRRDGKLVGFTYNKKQSVRAFHLHSTQGEFESISCIPSPDGTQDEVWFITKRTLGQGSQSRNVEYMHNGIPLDIPSEKYEDKHGLHDYMLKNCVYLDSAKKYHFDTPDDTLTGLSHLEGLEVGVLADGIYVGKKTVENGQIVLNAPATDVIVGLSYTTIVEPMPINVDMPNGSGQARSQRINQVIVRLYRTASFEYSWGKEFHKAPVKDEDALDLMSGDLLLSWGDSNTEIKLNNEDIVNSTGSRMIFRQTEPLPVYFVSIYPQLEVSNG